MNRTETAPRPRRSTEKSVLDRMSGLWRYRELLVGLVRKELKVKYKGSAVGFLWSMLNPALYLVVFYFAFQVVLRNRIPNFAIYLLSGLLVWNLFSTALAGATRAVVGNAAIVKKVSFPREVLPLASVGAAFVHFLLQSVVLLGALALFRYPPSPTFLLLVPVALVSLLLFTSALAVALSAVNVYARDTEHLIELVLLAWFWATPIVYQYRLVADQLGEASWVYRLNPVTPVVLTFQRAIYNRIEPSGLAILPAGKGVAWYLGQLGAVAAFSLVVLSLAFRLFGRLEGNFAEEL
ncbi:MAG: ABC transporter permease [Actinomycetota bacterium]|nr:ABC transporter permease [Actinomycetota bacterium]